jgi:hypothetical protein
MTNLTNLSVNLDAALKKLRQRWNETKVRWPHEDFEKEYWLPLEKQTSVTWQEMDKVAKIIDKAEQQIGRKYQR